MIKKSLAGVLMVALSFVLCMACAAFAQSKSAWESLSALQTGHKIEVKTNAKKVSGAFVSVSDTAISLQAPGGEETIPRTDVRSVKLMENKHRLRNAAIGAAIGAGVGAGAGAAAGRGDPADGIGVGILAVIGGAAGALVGVLWPSHQTIYRAAAR